MRVIAFKIWSDYAHFRRHYTTSSPLTHSIPPPSALRGLVGAIMGYSRGEYPEKLGPNKAKFGVRLLRPVKKIRLGMNYMDTKDGAWVQLDWKRMRPAVKKDSHGNPRLHTQIRMEFLKDPFFEIFFHHSNDELMDEFAERLENRRSVFTPYLGITECIANFEFLWDIDVSPAEGLLEVVSAFGLESIEKFKLKGGTGMVRERIPLFIDAQRIRTASLEVIFNPYAEPIWAEVRGAFSYPDESDRAFAFLG